VIRLLLCTCLVAFALVVTGCSDSFNPPGLPDLKKVPYDFGVIVPPFGNGDMHATVAGDMAVTD
jgi:hypothetical protein